MNLPVNDPLISIHGVTKRFPGVTALDGVSFDVRGGVCMRLSVKTGRARAR